MNLQSLLFIVIVTNVICLDIYFWKIFFICVIYPHHNHLRTVKLLLLLRDMKVLMIFIVMALESQIRILCSCHYTRPPHHTTCKDIFTENMFIPVHQIYIHILRAGPSFAWVSLCRPFNMRRARIISWFTMQNLCSSDIFNILFSFCLINSFPNRE